MQRLLTQRALKAVARVLSTVGDHADMKVVADAVSLGAVGDDGIERLVEHIRQKGGLALSAVQAMIHRRRLIHYHQDRRRRRAADFGLVTQRPHPCPCSRLRQVTFVTLRPREKADAMQATSFPRAATCQPCSGSMSS